MMSSENSNTTALRIVVSAVKSEVFFKTMDNVRNGLQAETSVSCK